MLYYYESTPFFIKMSPESTCLKLFKLLLNYKLHTKIETKYRENITVHSNNVHCNSHIFIQIVSLELISVRNSKPTVIVNIRCTV